MPPPHWEPSSYKHGVPREDQVYAMLNATYRRVIASAAGGEHVVLYIGPEHAQTDRELEILVRMPERPGGEASVFHAMPLGPRLRRYREENPDGRLR